MQWFSDLINPARPEKDPQEWLQVMSFLMAALLAMSATYLVLKGSITGRDATSLLLGLVIIFMAGSGLIALTRVAANTTAQIQLEKFKSPFMAALSSNQNGMSHNNTKDKKPTNSVPNTQPTQEKVTS